MDRRTLMDFNAIAYMADHYGDFTPEVNAKIIRWSEGQDVYYTREGKNFLRRLNAINRGQALEDDCVICGRRARNGVVCGRCIDQFIEIDEEDDESIGYEPQYSSSGQQRKNYNSNRHVKSQNNGSRWATGKLIIGIASIVLFLIVTLQSCAAGLSNALTSSGESSGSFGFISAILFLLAGIVGICVRKKGLGAHITVCVFYYLIFFMAAVGAGTYSDLKVWGVIAFIFGAVFLFSAINTKKGYIIAGIVSALVFLICITSMSTASGKKEKEAQNTDLSNMNVEGDVGGVEDKDLSQMDSSASTDNTSNASEGLPSISETVLLDNSGIVIKAVEMIEDSIWGPCVKLYIENNSDKNVSIYCDAVIVNDYMIYDLFSASVAAGKKTNADLNLSSASLKAAGIDNIGKIEVYFRISDDTTYDTIYRSDCITLQTSDFASMDVTPNDAGVEILNQDGVRVVAKYVEEDTFWGKSILLYLENNTQRNITVSVDNLSINGYMTTPLFSSTIYSGKKAINDISLLSTELEANGITSVDDVELSFHVFDEDTYDDIINTEAISFSTH